MIVIIYVFGSGSIVESERADIKTSDAASLMEDLPQQKLRYTQVNAGRQAARERIYRIASSRRAEASARRTSSK